MTLDTLSTARGLLILKKTKDISSMGFSSLLNNCNCWWKSIRCDSSSKAHRRCNVLQFYPCLVWWSLTSFLSLWLSPNQMKRNITLTKITVLSGFEHCWKDLGNWKITLGRQGKIFFRGASIRTFGYLVKQPKNCPMIFIMFSLVN